MSDCTNGELRDLLPDLLHGTLDAGMQRTVEAHVASCTECAEELALLRSLRAAMERSPAVDVQRIAAAVNARTTHAPRRPERRTPWRIAIAAAALLAVGGIGYAVSTRHASPPNVAVAPAPTSTPRDSAAQQAVAATYADADVIGSLADLSDADVRVLAASLDTLSALPGVEPASGIDPLGASLDDYSGGK